MFKILKKKNYSILALQFRYLNDKLSSRRKFYIFSFTSALGIGWTLCCDKLWWKGCLQALWKQADESIQWHILYHNRAASTKKVPFTFRETSEVRKYKLLVDTSALFFKHLWVVCFYCPAQGYALSTMLSLFHLYKQKDTSRSNFSSY